MQSLRLSARIGAILSLLGGALVIYSVFFLPMFFGNGVSSADVPNFEFVQFSVLLVLPLLSVLIILGTSAVSFFRELSPGMAASAPDGNIGALRTQSRR